MTAREQAAWSRRAESARRRSYEVGEQWSTYPDDAKLVRLPKVVTVTRVRQNAGTSSGIEVWLKNQGTTWCASWLKRRVRAAPRAARITDDDDISSVFVTKKVVLKIRTAPNKKTSAK